MSTELESKKELKQRNSKNAQHLSQLQNTKRKGYEATMVNGFIP